jgi:hypothetical protein
MGRHEGAQHAIATSITTIFPKWGAKFGIGKPIPGSSEFIGAYISDLRKQAIKEDLELVPEYVDVNGEPLVFSPFELKHRQKTYESIVSVEFKSFWARVEAVTKAAQNVPEIRIKRATLAVKRALRGLSASERAVVIAALAREAAE